MIKQVKLSIVLLFFLPGILVAQKLDSLELEKLKAQAEIYDSTGYKATMLLGQHYYYQDDQKNLRRYIIKEFEQARHSKDNRNIIDAYYHDILYHQFFSGKDSVFEASQALIDYVEGDTSYFAKRSKIKALIQIGANFYHDYNDNKQAYKYYRMAQEEALNLQDKDQYAYTTKFISQIYQEQDKYIEAKQLIDTAFVLLKNFKRKNFRDYYRIHLSYSRALAMNALADNTSNRKEIYQDYLEMLNFQKQRDVQTEIVNMSAMILKDFSDYLPLDTLLRIGKEAIEVNRPNPDLFLYHAKNLMKLGLYQAAKKNLNIGLVQAFNETEKYTKISEIYDVLTQVHLKQANAKAAENTYAQYKIYQDSAIVDARENEIEIITANFELEKKEVENLALKKETEILSSRAWFLTIIGSLLLGLLGVVLYFFRKIRSQAKKLEKLNETKNKIFTILAHDLKGPSLIFNNLAKKLNFLISKNDNNRLLEMADYYEESGRKVSRIINGVLDWAIAEKDSFISNPEEIAISPILKNILNDFKFELEQKNLTINMDVQENANIFFDKNAFQIINRNLLHNAIKFSPLDTTINIKFDKQFQSLEYIDCGKGFDPATANKILQMMPVTSSEGTMNEKGTGIGLVTCVKLLKENHGIMEIQQLAPIGTKVQLQFEKSNN